MSVALVFAALSADSAVTALVPVSRITPLKRTQSLATPAIVLQRVSTTPTNNLVDDGGLDANLIQIDYYGTDYTALKAIAEACRTTLTTNYELESELDGYEAGTDPELCRITQTWSVFVDR